VGRSVFLGGQHAPNARGGAAALPNLRGSFQFMRSPFVEELPNLTWGGAFILGSATPPIPSERSCRVPNFGVLLYLCLHPLTPNYQIRHF